jgi:hypothetical protein
MPRSTLLITAALPAAAVARAIDLAIDSSPLATDAGAVLAIGMVVLAIVASVGLVVARSRWARLLGLALGGLSLGLATVMDLDPSGWTALVLSTLAVLGLSGPWLTRGWLRHLPSATGPPPVAVAVVLGLLALPVVAALAGPGGLSSAAWVVVGLSTATAWGLSRALTPALWAARIAVPVAALGAGLISLPGGLAIIAAGGATTLGAWQRDVALAVSPLIQRGNPPVPVPPELVPPDLLEAAGFDDRGRPFRVEGE